jgi:hypothetical protein
MFAHCCELSRCCCKLLCTIFVQWDDVTECFRAVGSCLHIEQSLLSNLKQTNASRNLGELVLIIVVGVTTLDACMSYTQCNGHSERRTTF